ncbi:MAG TPA: DegT/DnrJ/EryC1/StrS family aminotransferase [Candidatus Hydrogenedentes bacterium]|nr:DegT/DnrJ/EryC1/StrS family aminotransferase [Candidatus Hydrogenedentota bacterium]
MINVMKVPMLDLCAQYATIKSEIDAAVAQVLSAQQFRGGPLLETFEAALASFAGVRHALGVSSGTDALFLALKALPLTPGDEIITSPFTFFATASAIVHAGCIPAFADIEPDTLNLDAAAAEARITPRTRAILPVHIFGQCARMDALIEVAKRHSLLLIEDAAQALGATYQGRSVGAWSDAATLSFYPTKNLGAAGEGGAILTNNDEIAERIRLLRSHGSDAPYHHSVLGFQSHLHTLQAAILHVKLRHLPEWNEARRERAHYYDLRLGQVPGIKLPVESEGAYHVYHQYVIRVPQRDTLRRKLGERGIGCGVFYPAPLYKQPCLSAFVRAEHRCVTAEQACEEVLALPMYPELTPDQQDAVVDVLEEHVSLLPHLQNDEEARCACPPLKEKPSAPGHPRGV